MQQVRVAHIINRLGVGGVHEIVYHFLRCLPEDRYQRYLYSLRRQTDHADFHEKRVERLQEIGVTVGFPERDKKKFYVVSDLCRWLLENRIEILHTHSYKPNIYGRLAGLLCPGIKIVAHYHNYYDDKWDADDSLIYDQRLGPLSHCLIACSEAVRTHVSERTGIPSERIRMVLDGVDLKRFSARHDEKEVKKALSIPPDRKVVGMIGRISEQKAQDDFINAAAIIKQAVPDALFLIVGEGEDPERLRSLKDLTVALGIEKEVIFTGYVADIPKVYCALDLLIVPSRWEGFGLILAEAMASGTPVVATDVGPISEVVGREGAASLVPVDDPGRIADEAIRILNDPEFSKKMIEKGKTRASLFSWEKAGTQLDLLYKALLDRNDER